MEVFLYSHVTFNILKNITLGAEAFASDGLYDFPDGFPVAGST